MTNRQENNLLPSTTHRFLWEAKPQRERRMGTRREWKALEFAGSEFMFQWFSIALHPWSPRHQKNNIIQRRQQRCGRRNVPVCVYQVLNRGEEKNISNPPTPTTVSRGALLRWERQLGASQLNYSLRWKSLLCCFNDHLVAEEGKNAPPTPTATHNWHPERKVGSLLGYTGEIHYVDFVVAGTHTHIHTQTRECSFVRSLVNSL